MAAFSPIPTRGRITRKLDDGTVVFHPTGTKYELHLKTALPYDGPIDEPLEAVLRVSARKVYTVPSGGNFISPIFGPPKIIQGRVKYADESKAIVHAGATFIVDLPPADSAIDLANGRIAVGSMINVVALGGAAIELVNQPVIG